MTRRGLHCVRALMTILALACSSNAQTSLDIRPEPPPRELPPLLSLAAEPPLSTLTTRPAATPVEGSGDVPAAWWSSVQQRIAESEYEVSWQESTPLGDLPAAFHAVNRAQNLRTYFAPEGFRAIPRHVRRGEATPWEWGLSLASWGREDSMQPVGRAVLRTEGNRIVYQHAGFEEWYLNDARGLEQGFTIHSPPPGASTNGGKLRLEFTVAGSTTPRLSDNGAAVDFFAPGGARVIRFANLAAFDADRRGLPAAFDVDDSGIAIVVDDRSAVYPITIDPLATSPSWTAEGDQVGANFGTSVASAGDVNGDGFGDVIVGAEGYDNGQYNEGRAFVYLGSAAGLGLLPAWTGESDQETAYFGVSVNTAGDVNGDGFGDIIVGAHLYNNGEYKEGAAFVWHGSRDGLRAPGTPANADWTADGDQDQAYFGTSVATAGDVNGDGYSDVIVGASEFDSGQINEGGVFVFHGSPSGLSPDPYWRAKANQAGAQLGAVVAMAGDVNGDGYSDVVAGSPYYDNGETDEGAVFVWCGSPEGLGPDGTPLNADWFAEGDQVGSDFGRFAATAGDVNGDGYSDLIVGADWFDNGQTDEGRAFAWYGSPVGLGAPGTPMNADWSAESNQAGAWFGFAAGTAGDINGDGFSDVVIGSPYYAHGQVNEGGAFAYLGSALGLTGNAYWTGESDQANAAFGNSVNTAGDVNGDGFSDVIIGSSLYDRGQTDEGGAFVYQGSAAGLSVAAGWMADGAHAAAFLGTSVAAAGDANGDGYDDVIVGAPFFDDGQIDEGRVFAYYGSASGLGSLPAWSAESDQAGALFGFSVGSGGDVNGDGYDDVIVGAYLYDHGEADEGRAFVYYGSATGLSPVAAWTTESDQALAYLGHSVSTAGDVNADGYSDVIIGVPYFDNGQDGEGLALVYLGSASGLGPSPAWMAESNQPLAYFGLSVSTAGDVNGDGYSDIMIGSPYYDNGQVDEGRAFVYHGSEAGPNATADWISESNQAGSWLGHSVAAAGDVNGDGYGDVIVGAPLFDNDEVDEGRAVLYQGSATGLGMTPSWTAEGDQVDATFGYSVATGGDVNGDGYCDVIVGARKYDNGQVDEGRAFVYQGSASGLSISPAWTAESNQAGAIFGLSVGLAGDVNGDGYSDVIVGAPYYDGSLADEGRAFVYYGNDGGSLTVRPQQRRTDDSAPIARLGLTDDSHAFRLAAIGRSPLGRGWAKLQWEIKPLGSLMDANDLRESPAWLDTGTAGVTLNDLVEGLTTRTPYHWRLRVKSAITTSPFQQHGPWFSSHSNGWNETDLRTGPTVPCLADLNEDGLVDFIDFLVFLNYYIAQDPAADFTGDGLVDFSDYLEFLNLYEAGC